MFASWKDVYPNILGIANYIFYHLGSPPTSCLLNSTSTTLIQLVTCFDSYTVPKGYYDEASYNNAQPEVDQRVAWSDLTTSLLYVDGNCTSVKVPPLLESLYTITLFEDDTSVSYCVLSEVNGGYRGHYRGWGFMIVPATRAAVSRNLHISAPHPRYDVDTPRQAAALFKSTGSKSLLITGRARNAYLASSACVSPSDKNVRYYITDPAHDKDEPFFDASKAIFEWQKTNGGCPASSCAYIQFHEKARTTCPSDHIFLSSGLGNGNSSKEWYTDSVDRPIKRLKTQLKLAFPAWNVSLPSDSLCGLTATKNVFGRLVNGIEESRICSIGSNAHLATGEFVHIEQSAAACNETAYDAWTLALLNTFDASCAPGLRMHPSTKLCI